jgi:hypothetical protein
VRSEVSAVTPEKVIADLVAVRPDTNLARLIQDVIQLSGTKVQSTADALEYVRSNPGTFCSNVKAISIQEPQADVLLKRFVDIDVDIEEHTRVLYNKLYIDVFGNLPQSLGFRILKWLDNRSLVNICLICQRWNNFMSQNSVWKWLSYLRGWGVAFLPPKSFEWRKFYQSMTVAIRKRSGFVRHIYDKEMRGNTGLK